MRFFARVQPVTGQQHQRQYEKTGHLSCAERMLTKNLEHIRKQSDARSKQDQTQQIEWRGLLLAIVRQMLVHEDEPDQTDGYIEKENYAPVKIHDDQSTGD